MEKILKAISEQLEALAKIVPNLITAILVVFIGFILAKVLRKLVAKILTSIGIDKLADKLNDIDVFSSNNIRIVPSILLSSLVYYLVLFVFIMVGVDALGMEPISELMASIINYFPKAISAFVVLIIGIVFCDLIKTMVHSACDSLGISSARFLASFVFYFLFLNVVLIAMKQAELQTSFMENNISIILGGVILAFSIGYGLASKPLMANMLSSVYHKGRFQIGDELSVDDQRGKVINLDSTSLTLRVNEDDEVIIPLSKLSTEQFTVHNRSNYMPLDEPADS